MKIGILTFHWPTNYGAVLQTFALMKALESLGHKVNIINFKPKQFDLNIINCIKRPHRIIKYIKEFLKENKLNQFRNQNLKLTKRFYTSKELESDCNGFDIIISGSDQVFNPWFFKNGEKGGSSAYFLGFCNCNVIKATYAASFGTVDYPDDLIEKAKSFIPCFKYLSVRENTGKNIFSKMDGKNIRLVPDPTLLHDSNFYNKLITNETNLTNTTRYYILHGRENQILKNIKSNKPKNIGNFNIIKWINSIKHSTHLITNSYHGVIFSLIYHVPFSVVLHTKDNIGMNDRFYTLLTPLCLTNRIFSEKEFSDRNLVDNIDWDEIDSKLGNFRKIGWDYLKQITEQNVYI